MAAKSKKKGIFQTQMDPATESVAIGSAFSVFFFFLLQSLVMAAILGLALGFAHLHGRKNGLKK